MAETSSPTPASVCDILADLYQRCTDALRSPHVWPSDTVLLNEVCDVLDRTIHTIKVRNGLALDELEYLPVTVDELRDLSKTLARHGGNFYELHSWVGLALPTAATFLGQTRTVSEESLNVLLDQMLDTQCADAWDGILGDCEAATWLRDREIQCLARTSGITRVTPEESD